MVLTAHRRQEGQSQVLGSSQCTGGQILQTRALKEIHCGVDEEEGRESSLVKVDINLRRF